MGWDLLLFLKQCAKYGWLSDEQVTYIHENMNVPTCSLLIKMDEKIRRLENELEGAKIAYKSNQQAATMACMLSDKNRCLELELSQLKDKLSSL
jgi:hypothetical protein